MIPRIVSVFCLAALCGFLQAGASSQNNQSSAETQKTATGIQRTASGEKTLTGCVAREQGDYVLKTDEGTYEFNTSRDLAPYVGKKVRISGRWNATGVTTIAPIKATAAGAGGAEAAAPSGSESKATHGSSFVGDLRLHITGTVIGDCAQSQ